MPIFTRFPTLKNASVSYTRSICSGPCIKNARIQSSDSRICFAQAQLCGAWVVMLFTFTLRAAQSGRKKGVHVNITDATEVHFPAYDLKSFKDATLHFKSLWVMSKTSATVSGLTWTFKYAFSSSFSLMVVTQNNPEVQATLSPKSALGSESGNPKAVQKVYHKRTINTTLLQRVEEDEERAIYIKAKTGTVA